MDPACCAFALTAACVILLLVFQQQHAPRLSKQPIVPSESVSLLEKEKWFLATINLSVCATVDPVRNDKHHREVPTELRGGLIICRLSCPVGQLSITLLTTTFCISCHVSNCNTSVGNDLSIEASVAVYSAAALDLPRTNKSGCR